MDGGVIMMSRYCSQNKDVRLKASDVTVILQSIMEAILQSIEGLVTRVPGRIANRVGM